MQPNNRRFLIYFRVSCEKNNNGKVNLNGAWLEISNKTDTLVFGSNSMATLYRGVELINGYLLPKEHSGPYFYETNDESIKLISGYSSSGDGKNYYFYLDSKKDEIRIGNFFVDSLSENDILIFSKIAYRVQTY